MSSYCYDTANRLGVVTQGESTYTFAYNGLGDRLQQTVGGNTTNYTLDLNAGLTQVLADGTNSYLYGLGRIGQSSQPLLLDEWQYHLPDALGSLRQLTDSAGAVSYAQSFEPYGESLGAYGSQVTSYGFAGEWTDATRLQYLRARYYSQITGAFFQVDPFEGLERVPRSFHPYQYAYNNPIIYTDPRGKNPMAILLAGVLTFAGGVLVGTGIGYLTYEPALGGTCGCDMQRQAMGMAKSEWIEFHALSGGVITLVAAALASTGPAGVIVVGGATVLLSGSDLLKTIEIIKNETGWTTCTTARLMLDVAGIFLGTAGALKGIQAWRESGSLLGWSTATRILNAKGALYPDVDVEGYGKVPFPNGPYGPNNTNLRSQFTMPQRIQFKEWWRRQGWPYPARPVETHHIKPLEFGGTNVFENLVPLGVKDHRPFTTWWASFVPGK